MSKSSFDSKMSGHLLKGVSSGYMRLIRDSLAGGADPNARCIWDRTVLHRLLEYSKAEVVREALPLLLVAGADPNARDNSAWGEGETCLHIAANHGKPCDVVVMLLKAGADPLALDNRHRTVLDCALPIDWRKGCVDNMGHLHSDVVTQLVLAGANPHYRHPDSLAPTAAQVWMQWNPSRAEPVLVEWERRYIQAKCPTSGASRAVRPRL